MDDHEKAISRIYRRSHIYLIKFIIWINPQSSDRLRGSGGELMYLKQIHKTTQYRGDAVLKTLR